MLANLSNPLSGGASPTTGIIAGGTLYGLNGQTIVGNSSGAWTVTANGTNQNITLTPSGSGVVAVAGNLTVSGTKFLLGTAVDSSALLQVGTNTTTSAGGMVFGTDTYLFRAATGQLVLNGIGANSLFKLSKDGTITAQLQSDGTNAYLDSMGSLLMRTGSLGSPTTAVTLDASQHATFAGVIVHKSYTVASLPTAASYTYGIVFVSDATNAAGANIGTAPTGGGAVKRAVYSDGTNWLLL